MQIQETQFPRGLVIGLTGRLDSTTSPLLDERLSALIEGGQTHFVFDCVQLNYLSSAGIRLLLTISKKLAPRGGKISLAAAKHHVLEVLCLGGLDAVFPNFATVQAALSA
jgi:anti-anti-sigma factor